MGKILEVLASTPLNSEDRTGNPLILYHPTDLIQKLGEVPRWSRGWEVFPPSPLSNFADQLPAGRGFILGPGLPTAPTNRKLSGNPGNWEARLNEWI
jgi:hypothetical protein